MAAVFGDVSAIQHIDVVRPHHICQPVEMRSTVLVFASRWISAMMSFSLSTSMLEVASSKMYTGLSCKSALASASR